MGRRSWLFLLRVHSGSETGLRNILGSRCPALRKLFTDWLIVSNRLPVREGYDDSDSQNLIWVN
jgi:hypothetical protein